MNTNSPKENQAEKHSPTPWITGAMLKHVVYDGNAIIVCDCGHRANADCSDANAAHIVTCVNERDSLTAELSTLRKELEAAKKAQGWVEKYGYKLTQMRCCSMVWEPSICELRELLKNGKDGK